MLWVDGMPFGRMMVNKRWIVRKAVLEKVGIDRGSHCFSAMFFPWHLCLRRMCTSCTRAKYQDACIVAQFMTAAGLGLGWGHRNPK
jgi:hypothetical protein